MFAQMTRPTHVEPIWIFLVNDCKLDVTAAQIAIDNHVSALTEILHDVSQPVKQNAYLLQCSRLSGFVDQSCNPSSTLREQRAERNGCPLPQVTATPIPNNVGPPISSTMSARSA